MPRTVGKDPSTPVDPLSRTGRGADGNSTPSRPRQRGGTPGPEVATPVQGRFKRGSGAAGDPESREPAAAPHQAVPQGGPGDRAAGNQAEPGSADTIENDDQKSKRAKLRSTLTRRRATGLVSSPCATGASGPA